MKTPHYAVIFTSIRTQILLLLAILSASCAQMPQTQELPIMEVEPSVNLSAIEREKLQTGDILLRQGYGFVSDYIVQTLNEPHPLTHCGLLIRHGDHFAVLCSESDELQGIDGVQMTDLRTFQRDAQPNSLMVVRFKNSTIEQQNALERAAKDALLHQKPFDYSFDMHDSSRLYCAELLRIVVKKALKKDIIHQTIRLNTVELLTMKQFYDSTHFEIIIDKTKAQSN